MKNFIVVYKNAKASPEKHFGVAFAKDFSGRSSCGAYCATVDTVVAYSGGKDDYDDAVYCAKDCLSKCMETLKADGYPVFGLSKKEALERFAEFAKYIAQQGVEAELAGTVEVNV